MTQKQIFETIAEAFERPPSKRTIEQQELDCSVCSSLNYLFVSKRITSRQFKSCKCNLDMFANAHNLHAYFWPISVNPEWTRECDLNRARMCREIAAKCK